MCYDEMQERFKKWWASWGPGAGEIESTLQKGRGQEILTADIGAPQSSFKSDLIDVGGLWHEKSSVAN